jgi:hypothetical protein
MAGRQAAWRGKSGTWQPTRHSRQRQAPNNTLSQVANAAKHRHKTTTRA